MERNMIKPGFCMCGCGQKTRIPTSNNSEKGWEKGIPLRFVNHHNVRTLPIGKESPSWKGGKTKNKDGRLMVYVKKARPENKIYEFKSRIIAQESLGKSLPENSVVHHFDGDHTNDKRANLIVCENESYHRLLHRRQRAYENCGNSNFRKCKFCKKYDDPINLFISEKHHRAYHPECANRYNRKRYASKRGL